MRTWILAVLVPHRSRLATILTFQLLIACLVAIQPLYLQRLIGFLIASGGGGEGNWFGVLDFALRLAGLMLAVALFQGMSGHFAATFSSDLLRQLQTDFFNKVAQLPLSYFHHQSFGEFFTRFNHDVGQTQSLFADVFPRLLRECITGLALILILAIFCPWPLVTVVVLVTCFSLALAVRCHRVLERYAVRQRSLWGEINKEFDETVRGIDTIKTFAAEDRRRTRFASQTAGLRSMSVNAGKIAALFSPAIDLVPRMGSLILLVMAYFLITGGALGTDDFLLFFFCAALLQLSAASMINLYTRMPPQLVGVRNLASYFAESEEGAVGDESWKPIGEPATIGGSVPIEFRNLHFAWPGGQDLYGGRDIRFPANALTVVRGPNGSGKSTLISLLLRFNDPDKGAITIGGVDVSSFPRKELRNKISVVTQYHHIFHDTLRENLLVARSDAEDAELVKALEHVEMGEFLQRQTSGLDQMLEAGGKNLSGGECQRVAIARLLIRGSPILILDEPWANLDDKAGRILAQILLSLKDTHTLIVMTHRMPQIRFEYDAELNLRRL